MKLSSLATIAAFAIGMAATASAAPVGPILQNNVCTGTPDYVEGLNGDLGDGSAQATPLTTTDNTYVICGMFGTDFGGDTLDAFTLLGFENSVLTFDFIFQYQLTTDNYAYEPPIQALSTEHFDPQFEIEAYFTGNQRNFYYMATITRSVPEVPLPASAVLLTGALAGLGAMRRRKRC